MGLNKCIFKYSVFYLITLYIIYNVFVVPVVVNQYLNFDLFNPHDFCERMQAVYGVFTGHPMQSSIMPWLKAGVNFNIFGDHSFVFLFLLIPFVLIFRNPIFIIILQTLVLSGGIFPIYLIAKDKLKDLWLALLVCIIYLFYPLTIKSFFYDFRLEYFAIFFLLWTFYFIEKWNIKLIILFMFLAGICKETILPVICILGVYIAFFKKNIKRKVFGIVIIIVSYLCLLFYIKSVAPRFVADGWTTPFQEKYGGLKNILNPEFLLHRITRVKVQYLVSLFSSLFFIPFVSKEVILILPGIYNALISVHDVEVVTHLWHNSNYFPFIFVGFISGVKNILKIIRNKRIGIIFLYLLLGVIIIRGVPIFGNLIIEPYLKDRLFKAESLARYRTLQDIKNKIPKEGRIMVHLPLISLFYDFPNVFIGAGVYGDREKVQVIDKDGNLNIDYFIYSEDINYSKDVPVKDNRELLKSIVPKGVFYKCFEKDGVIIFKRKDYI